MSECFRKVYIINNKVRNCTEFNSGIIYSGESIYEVIRVTAGVPVFLDDHLNRLFRTAQLKSKKLWLDRDEISANIYRILELNNIGFGNIKIVFNYQSRNFDTGNFLVYFLEHHYPTKEQIDRGIPSILYSAERDFPSAKIINQSLRSAIFKKLIDTHAYEALLVNNKGYITEGSRSNVFFVKDKEVYTAPEGEVLSGIARKYILAICESIGIKVHLSKVHSGNIADYIGVFISGTSPGVLPVSNIGEVNFDPKCNSILKIKNKYQEII